jgi:ribosomal protein S18 acetylase RimI-like enzyme
VNDLIIREMRAEDLDATSRLAAMLVRQHHAFDAKRFMLIEPVEHGYRWFLGTQLGEPDVLLLVAEVDGAIAGYLYGAVEERDWAMLLDAHGAIHDLFVDEAFRGLGVGHGLLTEGLRRLDERAPRVVLYSASANVAAQRLFARVGFRNTMVEMTRDAAKP